MVTDSYVISIWARFVSQFSILNSARTGTLSFNLMNISQGKEAKRKCNCFLKNSFPTHFAMETSVKDNHNSRKLQTQIYGFSGDDGLCTPPQVIRCLLMSVEPNIQERTCLSFPVGIIKNIHNEAVVRKVQCHIVSFLDNFSENLSSLKCSQDY